MPAIAVTPRRQKLLLFLAFALILLGLFPTRQTIVGGAGLAAVPWLVLVACVGLYATGLRWSGPRITALVVVAVLVGLPITFLVLILTNSGIVLLKGVLLVATICAFLALLHHNLSAISRKVALSAISIAAMAGAMSLGSSALLVAKDQALADERELCITQSFTGPVRSFADLRGGSFFAPFLNKGQFPRYFDGLLIVRRSENGPKVEFYEWLIRSQKFAPLHQWKPGHAPTPSTDCTPSEHFWSQLTIW